MKTFRDALPQLGDGFFLTDGGLETTLIFLEGVELPHFAAFHLLADEAGTAALRNYFRTYAELARKHSTGIILETPTWRSNPDWGALLGHDAKSLEEVNERSVELLEEIRAEYGSELAPVVVSGCIGPRGDGYVPSRAMSESEAEDYHAAQTRVFARTSADLVTALTMNYVEEAVGIARAAEQASIPVVISFTVETDGRLPTGQPLGDAIARVDEATSCYPAYYMINCAHPSHFGAALSGAEPWIDRLRGLRANASRMSHAELDDATELDAGDPAELGSEYLALERNELRRLNVMGGCCGTDHRHVERIAIECLPSFR
ncbi:MAG: homocysteine S-methyltransferase family protein [Isosphaeraceae bacterium]|nr:homocysteine S-methyltransferase family protein [Isosphaeraceae bacterium]